MFKVTQRLERAELDDPVAELDRGLDATGLAAHFRGPRIAITAGSRRIDALVPLLQRLVERLKDADLDPFIVPAMGSHGGATPDGQTSVLYRNGISQEILGAPVDPSMEAVRLGTTDGGAEAFCARSALESDGIVAINRVALHTGFSGRVQSGVVKMIAVGLGKADGARAIHEHGFGAGHLIGEVADMVMAQAPPVLGIGLVEDAGKRLSRVEVMPAGRIREREPELLREAARLWPRLPVTSADVLIVREMGKDISGTGMDPHVTGRGKEARDGEVFFRAGQVIALRLTEASGGNATGIGLADIITLNIADSMNETVTRKNVKTSGALDRLRMPLVAKTDRFALEMALGAVSGEPAEARVVSIRNTRELGEIQVSAALVEEARVAGAAIGEQVALEFNEAGDLLTCP